MIDKSEKSVSVRHQCELLSVCRSKLFYVPLESAIDKKILNEINAIWLESPFYGYRKVTHELRRRGYNVNHKKIQRLMSENGIFALTPKRRVNTSKASNEQKYPFLLKGVKIQRVNQVWSTDITYIKMPHGFLYLAAIIDVYSRMIVGWNLSTTMDTELCLKALKSAIAKYGVPEIVNTDQGAQFTSVAWISALKASNITISMDGKGRWVDNVYIERIWRTIKQESAFLMDFQTVKEAKDEIGKIIDFYNFKRLHQNLDYKTPNDVYNGGCKVGGFVYAELNELGSLNLPPAV